MTEYCPDEELTKESETKQKQDEELKFAQDLLEKKKAEHLQAY